MRNRLANLAVVEHIVDKSIACIVPLFWISMFSTQGVLRHHMPNFVAQTPYNLWDRQRLDEFFVVVNVTSRVNS